MLFRIHTTDFTREVIDTSDPAAYSYAKKNLIQSGVLAHDTDGAMFRGETELLPTSTVLPGMPFFLAALYLINNVAPFIYTIQIVLSMVTLFMIYKMIRLFGVSFHISAFTLFLAAVYPAFSYNLDIILTETVFITCLTVALYLFIHFLKCTEETKKRFFIFYFQIYFLCVQL